MKKNFITDSKQNQGASSALTKQEIKVARALLIYDSVKATASRLHISVNTVAFHTTSLRKKMGELRTHRAILKAEKLGLLD